MNNYQNETLSLAEQQSEGDSNTSPTRNQWKSENLGSETDRLLSMDEQYFLHQSLSTPCLNALSASEGCYIIDEQGRKILDFHGNSVHQVGFSHPKVIEAVIEQLKTLPFSTRRYTNRVAVEYARQLTEITPAKLNRVLFCPGGTSAIGMAMKLARLATGRHKTLSFNGSFHGASLDAISIGGEKLFRAGMEPLLPGCLKVAPVSENNRWQTSLREIQQVFATNPDIGAIIAEPIRWSTVTVPPRSYWQEIRDLCDQHGCLLVFDEIGTGFGRTGKMFAFEHFDVTPDILVLGKAMGGGAFPLAGIVTTDALNIAGDRSLGHYTHEKSPAACAAGLAVLEVLLEDGALENGRQIGEELQQFLRSATQHIDSVVDIRGFGMLIGVELDSAILAERTMYQALQRGLNFKISDGKVLTLAPPLILSSQQALEAAQIIADSIIAAQEN